MLQMVGDATSSAPLSYDWPSVDPDNQWVILRCEFEAGCPSGFYRVSIHDDEMVYLGDSGIHPRMTPDGRWLYVLRPESTLLYRVDVETGHEESICDLSTVLPEGWVYAQMRLSPEHLFIGLREPDIIPIRVDLTTGDVVRMNAVDGMLWACSADESRLIVIRQRLSEKDRTYGYLEYRKLEHEPGDRSIWSLNIGGDDDRLIGTDYYSHATILGGTTSTQGCGKWGNNSVTILTAENQRRIVCEGPYFWHSGASFDGEWIVADTNWPDYGIQLIHVPTGSFRFLCDHGSSLATGLLHAHPSLSNDGRIALYRSDRSGTCQAYLVHIPDELRESIIAGVSDEPIGGWQVSG
jgi:oligogalacturonide lyase